MDGTAYKTDAYESDTFVEEMDRTWRGLKPLYEQLHAYVRHKLVKRYGEGRVDPNGPIPAHLLGNMWGPVLEQPGQPAHTLSQQAHP